MRFPLNGQLGCFARFELRTAVLSQHFVCSPSSEDMVETSTGKSPDEQRIWFANRDGNYKVCRGVAQLHTVIKGLTIELSLLKRVDS
jgi:hypothetical protein